MRTRRHWHDAAVAVVTLSSSIWLAGFGCSRSDKEVIAMRTGALSSNTGEVLGFENPSDWHVTSGQSITLSSSTTAIQGAASLAVPARGFVTVQGATISISSALPGTVAFSLFLPPPVNPFWAGATQLYVDCHSHSIFNQYLGQQELTGQPIGQFNTESFSVPSNVLGALAHGCSDLSFTIAINVPTNSNGTYLLDNLQLGGAPAVVTCSATQGSLSQGTGLSISFSNQVTRPDLGTLVLNSTSTQGDPLTVTRAISLNGNVIYSVQAQTSSSGSSTTTITVSPPIVGVHQIVATSDGQTVTLVVDGRSTVPAPVANPAVQFVDGKPAPQVTAPAGLSDAIAQLLASAAQDAPTCLANGGTATESALLQAAVGTDNGHASGDSGLSCNTCEYKCYGEELLCAAEAKQTLVCSLIGSVFGFLGDLICTVVVDTVECTRDMFNCERNCHNAGTACCPVDCGGARNILTPIGLCCESGETCLKRGSTGHVSICCSSGQVACGGNQCCGSDTTCTPTAPNAPPSTCCLPGNIGPLGTCCVFGKRCNSDADCPASRCGADGCCTIG